MRKKTIIISNKQRLALDYIYVLIGSAIVAISFNAFLLPNKIASGGVSGISTIVRWTVGIEPSYVQWALNIPLFICGVVFLGSSFGYFQYTLKTLVGTLFLPFVVFLTSGWEAATSNPLLGAIFGGVGVGLGLGIVFRGYASTGGTDLAAQIISKYTGLTLGVSVIILDGTIVLISALTLSLESALYALIGMYLTAKMIDIVQLGFSQSKMAFIISNKHDLLRPKILTEMDRGVTRWDGYGGFTDDRRPILLCVLSQREITKLKQLVKDIDPDAFVIVANANEVLGEGFKRHT
ncbi:MAG: YitT family protein [Tuberibacillus sp.]